MCLRILEFWEKNRRFVLEKLKNSYETGQFLGKLSVVSLGTNAVA